MLSVLDLTRPLRLLCLGAHCDDIEIGAGGTILNLAASRELDVFWMVFSSTAQRACEARKSASLFLRNIEKKRIEIQSFRDGFLPYECVAIKESFEHLKRNFYPDLTLTHFRNDLHQDHRIISELTWNTFRNHMILEYEIPKYDGDFGSPNFFVELSDDVREQKIAHIMNTFTSQRDKSWFCPELFSSVLRLRGMESNAISGY